MNISTLKEIKNRRGAEVIFLFSFFLLAMPFLAGSQSPPPPQAVQTPVSPPFRQPPSEPYISISPDYFYTMEEILYIEGRSEPNAVVTVELRKDSGTEKPIRFQVKTDSAGEWVVAEKTYLSAGNWQVRARQQIGTLSSGESNPRVIRSVVTGVNIFGLNIRYVVIGIVGMLFLIVIVSLYIYFHRKIRSLERGLVTKQLKETEERFHRGFAEIRNELMSQLKELASNTGGRPLTPDEIEKRDRILRELGDLEKGLEHDVGDIGKRY